MIQGRCGAKRSRGFVGPDWGLLLLEVTHMTFPGAKQAFFCLEDDGDLAFVAPVQILYAGVDFRGLAAGLVTELDVIGGRREVVGCGADQGELTVFVEDPDTICEPVVGVEVVGDAGVVSGLANGDEVVCASVAISECGRDESGQCDTGNEANKKDCGGEGLNGACILSRHVCLQVFEERFFVLTNALEKYQELCQLVGVFVKIASKGRVRRPIFFEDAWPAQRIRD